ncbi:hypothetical protein BG015_004060 [Linnemannia schmuckeri]|uniref:Uncharacterized protein n=1 Tax=Linnemannia schmuckeri TaxID=64567 RepID=A0A9P5V141_9FUNG|nr:hypothetical protein BG015_004060 [Linnemannia schmuckeri]
MDTIAAALFKHSNSGAPKPPTQTRAQRQQQLQYPISTTICCIHLHDKDKIRLINAPSSLVPTLRQAIGRTLNQPIKQETRLTSGSGGDGGDGGAYEFRLEGKPWAPTPKTGPFITSTNLVLAMKSAMETEGWSLVLSSNVSRVREENDSLFFEWTGGLMDGLLPSTQARERGPDEVTLVGESEYKNEKDYKNGDQNQEQGQELTEVGSVDLLTVEFSGYDTISMTEAPVDILTALRLAILRHWTEGIEQESDKKGVHEFRLTGFPFQTWGTETTIEISMVIIQALENMRLHGYKLCSESIDRDVVGGKAETQEKKNKKEKKEKLIIDSWVLRRI